MYAGRRFCTRSAAVSARGATFLHAKRGCQCTRGDVSTREARLSVHAGRCPSTPSVIRCCAVPLEAMGEVGGWVGVIIDQQSLTTGYHRCLDTQWRHSRRRETTNTQCRPFLDAPQARRPFSVNLGTDNSPHHLQKSLPSAGGSHHQALA